MTPGGAGADTEARFRHEAEAAGRLNHPGIVQIYDVGPSYMVMEFLEGRPLLAAPATGRASVRQVVEIVRQVADAIDYAHRHGIVHRDIKPANVMLLDDGGVKVMDFGVARLDSSTLTALGTVVGSVRYMAPEQMMGERVDGRADVFSLAAVAYEMLTGQAPVPGQDHHRGGLTRGARRPCAAPGGGRPAARRPERRLRPRLRAHARGPLCPGHGLRPRPPGATAGMPGSRDCPSRLAGGPAAGTARRRSEETWRPQVQAPPPRRARPW